MKKRQCLLRDWTSSFAEQRIPNGIPEVKSYLLLNKSITEYYRVVQSCTAFSRRTRSEVLKIYSCNLMAGLRVESEGLLICRREEKHVSQWGQHFVWKVF